MTEPTLTAMLTKAAGCGTDGHKGEVTSEEWPEPQPLPVELPDVQPFNFLCLPEPLRPWIQDISDRMQCPPDFPAISAVISLGSLIGRKVGIRPKRQDDWLVVSNLWGMAVGRPGLMKTPALEQGMAPLNRLVAQAIEKHQGEIKDRNISTMVEEARAKLAQKAILGLLKNGDEKGARDIAERSQKEADAEPVLRRYVVNDSTVEKLGELLNQNPNGLLVHRDELVGFLRALDKEGREDSRAFYLEAWNGTGSFTCDRIVRGTLRIEAVTVSILGAIQPGPLQDYLRQATKNGAGDDGLLQRFQMAVWPDSPKDWRNVDRWPDTKAKNEAFEVFKYLDGLTAEKVGADTSNPIPFLRFSGDAQDTFDAWRAELEVDLRSDREHPALEAHLAKYRSLVPALALIIHLVNRGIGPVPLAALEKALLWAVYLESHARRLYSAVLRPDVASARELGRHIKLGDLTGKFTLRDTYRNGWVGLANKEDAEAATEMLSDLGWIRQIAGEPSPKGGRPAGAIFAINPRIRNFNALQDPKKPSVGGFVSSVSSVSKVNENIPPPPVEKYEPLWQGTDKTDKTLPVKIAVNSEKVEEDLF